jgi:hypothetical protein
VTLEGHNKIETINGNKQHFSRRDIFRAKTV